MDLRPIKKNAKRVIIYEGRFIRFVKHDWWEFVEHHSCTGIVIIVAMTKDQKILFVEQYRPPVRKNVIEFPAGMVNDEQSPRRNESLLQAAQRELWEETGYQAKRMEKLTAGPILSGMSSDRMMLVWAVDIEKTGKGGGDHIESLKIHEVPLQNVEPWLRKMERKGCLIEPKIYAGLYFAHKYNCKA